METSSSITTFSSEDNFHPSRMLTSSPPIPDRFVSLTFVLRHFDSLSQNWSRRPFVFAAEAVCNVAAGQRRGAIEGKLEHPAEAAPGVLAHTEASPNSVSSQSTTTEEEKTKVASDLRPATHPQGACQKENRRHDVDGGKRGKLFGWLPFWSGPSRCS